MLLSSKVGGAVHRVLQTTTRHVSTTRVSSGSSHRFTMFKNAANSYSASSIKKAELQQHFASTSRATLGDGSANVGRPSTTVSASPASKGLELKSGPQTGIKRSSSGLARALSSQDGFEEQLYPQLPKQQRQLPPPQQQQQQSQVANQAATSSEGLYFDGFYLDEGDLNSDFELEVENPAQKGGVVSYPNLQRPSMGTWKDSLSNITGASLSLKSQSDLEDSIPWSSSPLDHYRKPQHSIESTVDQFTHNKPAAPMAKPARLEPEANPRPSKRRALPWINKLTGVEEDQEQAPSATGAKTPKSTFSWNITASAMKQQQRQLRQGQKKLIIENEPTKETAKTTREKKKQKSVPRVFLSDEQEHVLNLVIKDKKSIFFTGAAGTGKSVLLREIITCLRKTFVKEPDRVAVTASTGLAACNIGGVTLHSFAGIGLGKEDVPQLVKKIKRNQKAKHRWMRTKVLVVDEISMVDGDLFDKLEEVARQIRNNGRPFGGIQLVITGDFFQLPPVPEGGKPARFAFNASTWNTSIDHTIGLHKVFRQKDPEFAAMLNQMREGHLDDHYVAKFKSLNRDLRFEDQLEATELFPTRAEVDRANNDRMKNLQGDTRVFESRDGGSISDKAMRDKLLSNCIAPETIHLKKGAQVMLVKNIDETLVNGSLGKVIGFMSESMFDSYHENEEEYYSQHSIDADGKTFAKRPYNESAGFTAGHYPVVRFAISDGTTRDMLCQRESWKVELPNGEVQASRSQIPLILAWALSIHKAQGQTMERVKVDLGRVFEKGQAYVALSRATSMAGLQILRFDKNKVMAHEAVRRFYAGLSRAESKKEDEDVQPARQTDIRGSFILAA